MNATEQKALLAFLLDGDLLGAIDYVEGARKPAKVEATGALKPLPRKGKFMKTVKHLVRGHLAVAPCGCTLYPDVAYQCAACIQARSPDACRALIAAHEPALAAFDKSMGFTTARTGDAYRVLHEKYDAELAALSNPERIRNIEDMKHKEARDACIKRRAADLLALDASRPWAPVRTRDFMINPHNGYYGLRDKVEVA